MLCISFLFIFVGWSQFCGYPASIAVVTSGNRHSPRDKFPCPWKMSISQLAAFNYRSLHGHLQTHPNHVLMVTSLLSSNCTNIHYIIIIWHFSNMSRHLVISHYTSLYPHSIPIKPILKPIESPSKPSNQNGHSLATEVHMTQIYLLQMCCALIRVGERVNPIYWKQNPLKKWRDKLLKLTNMNWQTFTQPNRPQSFMVKSPYFSEQIDAEIHQPAVCCLRWWWPRKKPGFCKLGLKNGDFWGVRKNSPRKWIILMVNHCTSFGAQVNIGQTGMLRNPIPKHQNTLPLPWFSIGPLLPLLR